jgi:DNA processing protein
MEQNNLYNIALTLVPGIGSVNARRLIAGCGNAENVFREKKRNLLKIDGIGEFVISNLFAKDYLALAESEINYTLKNNIRIVFFEDEDFPNRLKHCPDAPLVLYFKGETNFNNPYCIAVVGTRKATDYGKQFCKEFIQDIKVLNPLIVSGLAAGIDTCAHKESLAAGLETVGVLGHGLDMMYPAGNRKLAEQMTQQGGLLTDFRSGTIPDKDNFPSRNRIVAGMCDCVVVVEAAESGGALITADIANSYSRDVFALPGRFGDPYSKGCNNLIKRNKAALIDSASDLVKYMSWDVTIKEKSVQRQLFVDLSADEQIIYDRLSEQPLHIDDLCFSAGITGSKGAALLLELEFKGLVKSLPGKLYKKL